MVHDCLAIIPIPYSHICTTYKPSLLASYSLSYFQWGRVGLCCLPDVRGSCESAASQRCSIIPRGCSVSELQRKIRAEIWDLNFHQCGETVKEKLQQFFLTKELGLRAGLQAAALRKNSEICWRNRGKYVISPNLTWQDKFSVIPDVVR